MSGITQIYHGKPLIHAWTYCTANGAPLGYVGRYQGADGKKEIVPFFKRNGTTWAAGIGLSPRPLFGLDKLATHPKDKAVFIVEGEKSAAALQGIGIATVSSLGGSQAAKQADWTPLNGYKMVYLSPDNDEPGEHYARDVYQALMALETPPQCRVLRLSGLPVAGDAVDWLQGWVGGWGGYAPIAEDLHEGLEYELRAELKNAVPVPDNWGLGGLSGLRGGGCGVFDWEKPGEMEN